MTRRRRDDPPSADPEPSARVLPHNLEAERAVLGAILVHNTTYETARSVLRSEHFFREAHRRVFAAMAALLDAPHGVADLVTLKDALTRAGSLDEVGGPAYIASLIDGVPRATNVEHYAAIVREHAIRRAVIFAGSKMAADAYDLETPAVDVLTQADRRLLELQRGHVAGRMAPLAASIKGLFADMEYRAAHRGELTGIPTGYASINDLTMGWQRGDVIVIAARPSIGKTTYMMNTVTAAAQAGYHVAVFSFEMKRRALEYREVSHLSGVMHERLRAGALGTADYDKVVEAFEALGQLPIAIDDERGQTVSDIRHACRRLKSEGALDLVAIDYVQLVIGEVERRGANRNDEVTDISRRLKILADELNAPILLLSQLSRANEKRTDPRPKLSDLRESGALEQDADLVCFLHRGNHRQGGVTNFILEKQRDGPTGTVNLTLNRDTLTFTDGGEEPPAVDAAPRRPQPSRPHRYRTGEE